jgi:hypothetical protein
MSLILQLWPALTSRGQFIIRTEVNCSCWCVIVKWSQKVHKDLHALLCYVLVYIPKSLNDGNDMGSIPGIYLSFHHILEAYLASDWDSRFKNGLICLHAHYTSSWRGSYTRDNFTFILLIHKYEKLLPGSNLGRDTDYPEVLRCFPQSLQADAWILSSIKPWPLPSN